MATLYAWSNIRYYDSEKGRSVVAPGTKVTAEKLGLDDDSFQELIDAGAVRETPWPKGLSTDNPAGMSPNQFRLQELRKQREAVEAQVNQSGDVTTTTTEETPPNNAPPANP